MKLKRQAVKTYLNAEDYDYLKNEAMLRRSNLSQTIQACLTEYLALRKEMASAFITPGKLGDEHAGKIIHTLLSRTEKRIEEMLQMQQQKLIKNLQQQTKQQQHLLDSALLVLLQQLPLSQQNSNAARARAQKIHARWREEIADKSK